MIEKLWCENGQHWHERESKRGKKPKNCLDHAPAPAPKSASELNEAGERKLICAHGDGHSFWAPVQRGRPPRFCPEHAPPKPLTARQRSGSLGTERAKSKPQPLKEVHVVEKSIDWALLPDGKDQMPERYTRELYCHGGDHMWHAERKRGKPPRNCPKHAVSGAIERKGELDSEKKEKAKKNLQDDIARLSARVEAAEIVDRDAMSKLEAAGGVNKAEKEFKVWLRANSALLHEVEALRARERKLEEL